MDSVSDLTGVSWTTARLWWVTDCVCVLMHAHSVMHADGAVRFLEREAKDIGLPFKCFEVRMSIKKHVTSERMGLTFGVYFERQYNCFSCSWLPIVLW